MTDAVDGVPGEGAAPDGGAGSDNALPSGDFATNWKTALPEELLNDPSLQKFDTLEGLAKSYINAQSMMGRDKIAIPKTDDEWAAAYAALGRPDEATGYEFGLPEGLPDGLGIPDALTAEFKETMFQLGLNETQAKGISDWYFGQIGQRYTELTQSFEADMMEAETALKQVWGEKYAANLAIAQRAVLELGSEDLLTYFNESGLGNDPQLLQFLAGLGDKMLEGTGLEGPGQSAGQTPEDIQAEIGEIQSSNAYRDAKDPGHAAAVKKMQGLYQRLHAA